MTAFWRPFVAAILLMLAGPAAAEEVIRGFASTVTIAQDGTLDVVERIGVRAENVSINHGIYRDFPTRYDKPGGGRMKVGFELVETRLDGAAVDTTVEPLGNGVRIRMGSAETTVSPGDHLYLIHYRVTRELGYFDRYDELYWNVTGNGWDFPILLAGVQVNLPKPVPFGQRAFYTGVQGATGSDARVEEERPGRITIVTTRRLEPREGLTVAVAFPKGVVDPPSDRQRMGWWLADTLPIVLAGLAVASVLAFLVYAWKVAGRDPPEGTVVPLFAPPDDLSPAAMRYVIEQGFDDRAFAAALVDAGVKGHVILGEDEGVLFFGGKKYIMGATGATYPLAAPEQSAVAALVKPGERLDFDNKHHATFSAAKAILERAFKARFDEKSFKRNYPWIIAAVVIWAVGAYFTALSLVIGEGLFDQRGMWAAPVLGLAAFLLFRKSPAGTTGGCIVKGLAALLAFGAVCLAGWTVMTALATMRWVPIIVALAGLPLALSSAFWISAPTKEGRALLDRIAGFKQYLSITERERLDRMQAPRDTLQMFERWLPYAVALEVENRWADRFSSQLAAAAAAGQSGFAWYHGSHSPWTDSSGFADSIGSSLSSSVSSASTAPGSSSGSGGGGSSGGGGGGGGGGGW